MTEAALLETPLGTVTPSAVALKCARLARAYRGTGERSLSIALKYLYGLAFNSGRFGKDIGRKKVYLFLRLEGGRREQEREDPTKVA